MVIFNLLVIFSMVFSILSFIRPIEIAKFLKFNSIFFGIRVSSALIFFFYFSETAILFDSKNQNFKFLLFSVFLYIFCFYLYSKIVLKNFLRVGEIFGRFSLDALPGEQMAVESEKRDGLLSISEAQSKRAETIANSLKYTSIETVLRFLSSEPIVVSMLIVIASIFGALDYRDSGDFLKFKSIMANIFLVGSMFLVSGVLTLLPIAKFTLGSTNNDGRVRLNLPFFFLEVSFYSFALTFILSSASIIYLVLTNSLNLISPNFYFVLLLTAIVSFILFHLLRRESGEFLIYLPDFDKIENSTFHSTKHFIFDKNTNDLIISYYRKSEKLDVKFVLLELLETLVEMESLLIGIERIVLRFERNLAINDRIQFEWQGETYEMNFKYHNESITTLSKNYFLEVFSKKLASSIRTSDVIRKLNQQYYRNSNFSFIRGLEYSNFEFIGKCIGGMHSRGIVVSKLIPMVEYAMPYMVESDEISILSVISAYLASESSVFYGTDGICRVIYLEELKDITKLPVIVANLNSRNISPVVLVVSEEGPATDLSQIGNLYRIEKDLFPKNIDFFPLPTK